MTEPVTECIDAAILMSATDARIGPIIESCAASQPDQKAQKDYFLEQWRSGDKTKARAQEILADINAGKYQKASPPTDAETKKSIESCIKHAISTTSNADDILSAVEGCRIRNLDDQAKRDYFRNK